MVLVKVEGYLSNTLQNLSEKSEGLFFIFETCLMAVANIPGFWEAAATAALQASQLRNARTGSTGGTEQLPRNATGAHRSLPIYPSQGASLGMKHLSMRVSKAEGQLSTCTAFIKLPALDGCSCLDDQSQKDQTCPNLLDSWVSPRCFQLSPTHPVLRGNNEWERLCSSQGVQSSFHEKQLLASN